MNTRTTLMGLVVGAVLVGGGLVAATQAASALPGTTTTTAVTAADPALADELAFAREEERMARDLYQALADKYDGALPFSRITLSEQQHFDVVGTLLDRYDVADPAAGKKAGSYADPAIQKLYDGWLADASTSLDAAYDVGVALEQRDIADLKDTLAKDLPADVTRVFTGLLNASEHHLAAFQAAADGQVLGQQDGRGPAWGPGNGPGNGMSNGMGNGPGYGMDRGNGAGNGRGFGHGPGMMNGAGPGGNRAGFNGDCPMLDAS
jgi:hypothetical protein